MRHLSVQGSVQLRKESARFRGLRWAALLAMGLLVAVSAFSQEGHPLTGTWSGDWGPDAATRNHLTLVMNWDGSQISGILNPGPDSVTIDNIGLNVTDWTVRIQAGSGAAALTANGTLEDLGSVHRTITGTWRQGTVEGDFKLVRE